METSGECKAPVGEGICGETNTLRVIQHKFQKIYDEKLQEILQSDSDDKKDDIIGLQTQWIANLSEQNCLFVDTVEKLEYEACERVKMLEEKLHKSARYISEVMKKYIEHDFTNDLLREPMEKLFYLENDQKSLLEFISRIKNSDWSTDGLTFYSIDSKQLLSDAKQDSIITDEIESKLNTKQKELDQFQCKLKRCDTETVCAELKRVQDDYNALKKTMEDMRTALTEEVASKHDQILNLKRDCCQLEERCQIADKQIVFKDDIIKELRKEIKQLKQQNSECCNQIQDLGIRAEDLCKNNKTLLCEKKKLCDTITDLKHSVGFASKVTHEEVEKLNATIDELQRDLSKSKQMQEKEIREYTMQIDKLNKLLQKNNDDSVYKVCKICRGKAKVGFQDDQPDSKEMQSKIANLENDLRNSEEKVRNLQMAVDYYVNSVKLLEETNENGKIEVEQLKMTISNLQQGLITVKHELDEYKQKYDEKVECYVGVNKSNAHLQEMLYTLEIEHCEKLHEIEVLDKHLNNYKCMLKQFQLEKIHLKDLLRISNENAQQEVRNLKEALQNLTEINNKLKSQLESMEHKCELKNRFYKVKMDEMKQHLMSKDNDLVRHDQEIVRIREELEKSVNVNKDLYNNVLSLNGIVDDLRTSIAKYEMENECNKENKNFCMSQINNCRERLNDLRNNLEEKSRELSRLEKAYNKQCKILCETQKELEQRRAKQSELEERLIAKDKEYNDLYEEYGKLECEETKRNTQLKRYKKIVGDLKKTMIELNRNLPNKDLKTYCTNETCKWMNEDDDSCCTNCPCQYEAIKQSIVDLKSQLDVAKVRWNESKAELKLKQGQIEDLLQSRNEEVKQLLKECQIRIGLINDDEKRLQNLVQQFENEIVKMRDEIQTKTIELNNLKCNKMDCLQVVVTQEELNTLKNQLNKLLKKYCALNQENEQFMVRVKEIEAAVKQQHHSELGPYLLELKKINFDKESLIKKQLELLAELRIIQCSYNNCQRYDLMVNLKNQQYDQLVNSHNDICNESRNVCTYVKLWLEEQRNINKHIANKQKFLCDSIKRLQHTNNKDYWKKSSGNLLKKNSSRFSPCSLNSQESSSVCDSESPCRSPTTQWYSTTYKNDSEEDTTDNDENSKWLEKIHFMTSSVKKVNNMWKNAKEFY